MHSDICSHVCRRDNKQQNINTPVSQGDEDENLERTVVSAIAGSLMFGDISVQCKLGRIHGQSPYSYSN